MLMMYRKSGRMLRLLLFLAVCAAPHVVAPDGFPLGGCAAAQGV